MPNRIPTNVPVNVAVNVKTIDIPCFQLNNQKRIISCETLTNYCEREKLFLCLGQDPSLYNGKITGLNTYHTTISGNVDRPRAYIHAHKSLKIWPMENLCDQDTAVAMIDTGINNIGKIIMVSIYWDGRIDSFPQNAIRAMEKANNDGHTVLLGGDANARSIVYGSNRTDARGRALEQIFLRNNLTFLNVGTSPTCTASDQGSVIDITAITNTMENIVHGWKVSQKESNSDHKLIEFKLKAAEPETKYKTTMSTEQKASFTKDLDHILENYIPNLQPHETSIMASEELTNAIIKAYKEAEARNSTTRKIVPSKRDLIWKDSRVKEQNMIKN